MQYIPSIASKPALVQAVYNLCILVDSLRPLKRLNDPTLVNETFNATIIAAIARAVNEDGCRWVRLRASPQRHYT